MVEHLGSRLIGYIIGGALLMARISMGQEPPAVPEGVEVMARGPVH